MAGQPTKIGKYDVLRLIGRGGMGVVYEALDPKLERHVAIKMILGATPGLVARFDREARSTGSLQHQNIVTIYEFGDQDGSPYLVMEYLEGMSLDSALSSGKPLSLATKLSICVEVCNGLNYAHDRGIIHRDIKPANVMLLEDGGVKIVDFGIARIGDTGISRTEVVGSLHYMSPEQFQSQPLDRRTDIFSTGVVLYQLLTGTQPFQASGGEAAVMYRIIHDDPAPLSSYLQEYPPELDEIVGKALAKNRDLRYSSARDLAFDLMAVVEKEKHQEVQHWMKRADTAIQRTEWTKAEDYLRQVLKVDKNHTPAHQLLTNVMGRIREQRKVDQVRQLRIQADEAFLERRYDDALRTIEQAVAIDETNKDLVILRESIQEAKSRAAGFKVALSRAEEAHRAGDLEDARLAVREALALDPYEGSAKALQVVILKEVEERNRQQRLRTLLDCAREQITARNLTAAYQTLKEAEQVDSSSVEFYSLMKVVNAAREDQSRKLEMDKLTREIEEALNREDYAAAAAIANEGLLRQPRDQGLLRLKALAETQLQRAQLKAYARDQFLAASGLLEAGRTSESLSAIENALRTIPGDPQLERLRGIVKERLATEEAEQRKHRLLARAQELVAAEKFDEAIGILESIRRDFSGTEEIEPLLDRTRAAARHAGMVAQVLGRAQQLLNEGSGEQAVRFLENQILELPDARLFDLLERARRQRDQFHSGLQGTIEEGNAILQREGALEAARYLRTQAKYREIPEFRALVEVVANRVASEALDQELMGNTDADAQARLTEAALRAHPANAEIKKRLVTVRIRREEIHAIAEKARALEGSRQYSEAAKELQQLRQIYPQYPSLESEIRRLERLEEQRGLDEARRQQQQFQMAVQSAIEEGQRVLQKSGASEAAKYLVAQPSRYRDTPEFRQFAEVIAKGAAWEALDRDLSGTTDLDAQVRLTEAALHENPGNEEIKKRLAAVRGRKQEIDAMSEKARVLETSRQYGLAAKELRHLRQLHPQYPGLESEIQRLERLEEQQRLERARREAENFQSALRAAIEEGNRILQRRGGMEAAKFLSEQTTKYRDVPEFRAFAGIVAARVAIDALDQELSRQPDPEVQVRAAEAALRDHPGHEEIKKRLAAMRGRREQINAVVQKARSLETSRQFAEAAKELQSLRQAYPQYPALESEIRRLEKLEEQRVAEEARRVAEQFQSALHSAVEEGKRILQNRGASEAKIYLNAQPANYRETPDYRVLAEIVDRRLAVEALENELADTDDPDAQVRSAEAALRKDPANDEIKKRLAVVRGRREQINTIVEKARVLETVRKYGKAAKELQRMRQVHAQYPDLELEIRRLEGLEEQSKQPKRKAFVETPKAKAETPSVEPVVDHDQKEIGATVIMGRPRLEEPPAAVVGRSPVAGTPEVQPRTLPRESPEAASVSVSAQLSRPPKTWLIAAVAIVIVVAVGIAYRFIGQPATVLVSINPTPEDSAVTVDGTVCPIPCQKQLSPGRHKIAAEHEGYTSLTDDIQVPRAGSPSFSIALSPVESSTLRPAPARTPGTSTAATEHASAARTPAPQGRSDATHALSPKTGSTETKTSPKSPSLQPNSGTFSPALAQVVVRNLPASARVKLEGGDTYQADGSGMARFAVPPGNHKLEIAAEGYISRTIQQTFAAGGPVLDGTLDRDLELQEWTAVESSNDRGTVQSFLNKFPAGKHAELAKAKLDKLDKAAASNHGGAPAGGLKPAVTLTDSDMISGTLGQFEQAYSNKNAGEICGIWPNCPRKKIEEGFKDAISVSMKYQPSGLPVITGDTAVVACTRVRDIVLKGSSHSTGSDTVAVHFRKLDGKWRIDSIN